MKQIIKEWSQVSVGKIHKVMHNIFSLTNTYRWILNSIVTGLKSKAECDY